MHQLNELEKKSLEFQSKIGDEENANIKRDINIPEFITIRDLANRMAEQSSNIIKHLMSMGVAVTINHTIDSDTAEYLVKEFGHNPIIKKADETIKSIIDTKSKNLKIVLQ